MRRGAGLSPHTHPPAQPPSRRVWVREEAAIRDAELRRVSMVTQPGNPPLSWGAWAERGERAEPARGQGLAGAQRGTEAAVLWPGFAQRRQGSVRAPAWGTGRQSRVRKRVVLQPKCNLGHEEKEVLLVLGDPRGF